MSGDMTILKSLAILKAAYPRQELTDETIDIYEMALRDLDPALLKQAIMRLISKAIFFPTIAEIRSSAGDLKLKQMGHLLPLEAWHAANQAGAGDLPEQVKQAVYRSCGDFYNLRRTENQSATRARFIQAYNEIINEIKDETVELPMVKEYIALEDGNGTAQQAIKQLSEQLKSGTGAVRVDAL